MRRLGSRWIAWPALGLAILAWTIGNGLLATVPMETLGGPGMFWPEVATSLSLLAYAGVGALIVARRPRHPVGWVFLAMGSVYQVRTLAFGFVNHAVFVQPSLNPVADHVGWLANLWVVSFGLVPVLFLLFPSGRFSSRRWRLAAWAMLPATLMALARSGVEVGGRQFEISLDDQLPNIAGPVVASLYELLGDWLYLALSIPAVAALVARWRRSQDVERQQLTWFVSACVLLVLCVIVLVMLFIALGPEAAAAPYPVGMFLGIPAAVALAALPAAAGTAILRHRLYDIDRIVSRTIAYAVATAILAGVFAGAILLLQALLAPITGGQAIAVAASTLAAFVLFQPVLRRVRRAVDRRFDRARYDADRTAAAFSERLRDEVDLPTLANELDATVRGAIAPSSVALWLREAKR